MVASFLHYFAVSFQSIYLHHIILSFSLTVLLTASLTIFVQSPWSRLCCICLFKFVIITLHYITLGLHYITLHYIIHSRFYSIVICHSSKKCRRHDALVLFTVLYPSSPVLSVAMLLFSSLHFSMSSIHLLFDLPLHHVSAVVPIVFPWDHSDYSKSISFSACQERILHSNRV